jgi:hypothetical protein
MAVGALVWDDPGKRLFEAGVDRGVLYPLNAANGLYDNGVAWNGIYTVTETPAGAEANPQYADNMKYLNLLSAETFGGTIEAFTYPDEFALCDGTASPATGFRIGQQPRKTFGLSYRTKIGNDVNSDLGFKLHLVYGALASPAEKAYETINDSPAATTLSWDFTTVPAAMTGFSPVSLIVVDSTKVLSAAMLQLTNFLWGTAGTQPSLPTPDAVAAIFTGSMTLATPVLPVYTSATDLIAIPNTTGVDYYVNGLGPQPVGNYGPITQNVVVSAKPKVGYYFNPVGVYEWLIVFV